MSRSFSLRKRLLAGLPAVPSWLFLGIFFLLPLALMLWISIHERSTYGGIKPLVDPLSHFLSGNFLQHYLRSLDMTYLQILWRTLWLALATTFLCLLISYPLAYYIAFAVKQRWKNFWIVLTVIPFWTSFLVRTYAWVIILRSEGLANSFLMSMGWIQEPLPLLYNDFAVLVGLVYTEIPFMVLPIYSSLEKMDRHLLEAADDLGAPRPSAFWRVTVPLSMPGILAGSVLVFIPALGQFIIPDLLGGARSMLMGNLIQNQFTVARNKPFGSALAFELTAIILLLLLFQILYNRRKEKEVMT